MERVLGMILAGGRGSRMGILCHLRPKPVLPFAGRLRIIDFSLSNCIHSQVSSIAVLVDYQRSYMADYLGEWAVADAGSARIAVLQPESGPYTGTADAVYRNLAYLNAQAVDRVLVLAGDHVYRMDYRKMLDFHNRVKADATVGVIQVSVEEAHRFGTVVVDSGGRIQEFEEKSSRPLSSLASMGIYIFNKDVLVKHLVEDAGIEDSPHDFGYTILPGMVKRDRVFAYEYHGYWQDIGTIESYYQANMELLVARPRFGLDGNWPVLSDNSALPVPEGSEDGKVMNSLISPGCIIKGRVVNSILSPGVHVAEQAIVRNSVVMANTFVGYHSVVDSCVLDMGVQIGKFCYIGFGSSLLPGDCEITVLGKDVVVPSHTAIGRRCRVVPGLGPAAFGAHLVPSGTTLVHS
jgi:glucose-1-phosphate adenylyltransferase